MENVQINVNVCMVIIMELICESCKFLCDKIIKLHDNKNLN